MINRHTSYLLFSAMTTHTGGTKPFLRNETPVDVNRCVYCTPPSQETSVKENKERNEFIKGCEISTSI
jgi:hypothetical protein